MVVESNHEGGHEKIMRPEVSIEYTERLKFEKAVAEAERDKMADELAEKDKQLAENKKEIAELKKWIENTK